MASEVKVFLKCLNCGTFITSPAFAIIRKHFDKCQLRKPTGYPAKNENQLIDIDFDDFIDIQTETFTFIQPSVVLTRCNLGLEHSNKFSDNYNNDEDWESGFEYSDDDSFTQKPKQNKRKSGAFTTTEGKRRQKCDQCDKLINPRYMANHIKKFHRSSDAVQGDTYTCAYPNCGIKCKSVQLLKCHFIYHLRNNPYVCNFPGCKVKCDAPSHLKRHIKLQHLEPLIDCPKCRVSYASRDNMKKHDCELNLRKQRSGKYKLTQDPDSGWRLKRVPIASSSAKNEQPAKEYPVAHISSTTTYHSKDKTEEYIRKLKRVDINSIIRSDPGFIQACKNNPGFADLLFGGHQYLNGLQKSQSKQKSFKCSKCPTVFEGRHGYIEHMKHCQGGTIQNGNDAKKPPDGVQIGCPACGKPFVGSELLEKHLTEEHKPDEIFKCNEDNCGRYFSSDVSLQRHFRLRHIKREYQCQKQKCRARYKTREAFDKHLKQHRLDPNFALGKSSCEVCGQILAGLHSLRRHMQLKHDVILKRPGRKVKPRRRVIRKHVPMEKDGPDLKKDKFNGEVCVQVKIEPELIVPHLFTNNGYDDLLEFDQIGKSGTE